MIAHYGLAGLLEKFDITYSTVGVNATGSSRFTKIVSMEHGQEYDLIFINKPDNDTMKILTETKASCILLEATWGEQHLAEIMNLKKHIHLVAHPRLVVAKLLKHICEGTENKLSGIHSTAIIDKGANIHKNVFIGPYCIIGDCSIGDGSRIHAYTVVHDCVKIGKNVLIREHCVIGLQGFAFVREGDGTLLKLMNIGGVTIGDDVEIFPFTNIDCGTFGDTIIESGAKIDHFVHVAHNSKIGKNCAIVAGAVFCGSSSIGANSWAGVGSIVKESTKVGKRVILGLGAVVLKDVDDDDIVAGVPAKSLRRKD